MLKPLPLVALTLTLAAASAQAGPTAPPVRAEIDQLMARLQASACQFSRNGSWYTAAEAKDHLLRKLDYLEGRGSVSSTEQFIELAASKSSTSGQAYQVKCGAAAAVSSQRWLSQELGVIRTGTTARQK